MSEIKFRSDSTVELIDHMGDDQRVVRAARVSTGLDLREADDPSTQGLIRYLMANRHGSPFEKGVFEFRIECPIFVAREFMRHRIASYNEESARYKQIEGVFWVPATGRGLVQAGKPGHYVMEPGTRRQYDYAVRILTETAEHCYEGYELLLQEGICREVARACLTVSVYTSFYVTINARSLMNFLSLRVDDPRAAYPSKPQYEIDQAARQMEKAFANKMPFTWNEFVQNGRVAP